MYTYLLPHIHMCLQMDVGPTQQESDAEFGKMVTEHKVGDYFFNLSLTNIAGTLGGLVPVSRQTLYRRIMR